MRRAGIVLLLALLLIGRFCLRDRQSPHFLAPLVLGSYAAYELGLFLMYLLTMPTGEALILAGYSRYDHSDLLRRRGLDLCLPAGGVRPARRAAPHRLRRARRAVRRLRVRAREAFSQLFQAADVRRNDARGVRPTD